jgi:hypothetical protein
MFQSQGFPPLPAVLGAQGQMLQQQLGGLMQRQAQAQMPAPMPAAPQVVLQPIQLPSQTISVGSNQNTVGPVSDSFVFTQTVPSVQWLIPHTPGFPSVTLVNTSGQEILGEVLYVNNVLIFVNFNQPVAGSAFINF